MSKAEALRDISFYQMDYYKWRWPHQFNDRLPTAKT
jgi:putative transposase